MPRVTRRHLLNVRMLVLFKKLETRCARTSPHDELEGRMILKDWEDVVDLRPKADEDYCVRCDKDFRKNDGESELAEHGITEVPLTLDA